MPINLNEAGPQREFGAVIPDGTFCLLRMTIRPGNANVTNQDPADAGLFKHSNTSDAIMLDCEFTVQGGPHHNNKIFQNLVVAGGSVDEKGQSKGANITKEFLRAAIESATGISPTDNTPQAQQIRTIANFRSMDGIQFFARLGIQEGEEIEDRPGEFYADRNLIAKIITPADDEYAALRAGQQLPPAPSGPRPARKRRTRGAATGNPGWASGATAPVGPAAPTVYQPAPPPAAAAYAPPPPPPQPGYAPQPQPGYAAPAAPPAPAAPAPGYAPPQPPQPGYAPQQPAGPAYAPPANPAPYAPPPGEVPPYQNGGWAAPGQGQQQPPAAPPASAAPAGPGWANPGAR